MAIDKSQLVGLILESDRIQLNVVDEDSGEFPNHRVVDGILNDLTYNVKTKTLELWYNCGYEI